MTTKDEAVPVALVTGGSRGIGRSVAQALACQGYDVCISFLKDEKSAQETAVQIQATGQSAMAVKADVSSQTQVKALFKTLKNAWGRLDAAVNNAGVVGEPRSLFEVSQEHLAGVFQTNVLSCFFVAGEAAKMMSTQLGGQGGAIVNISSIASRHGGMHHEAHYAASKGAVDSLTLAMAKELAPHGIRVNAVRPGLIQTSIHDVHGGQDLLERIGPTVPLGRVGQAQEVADLVAYLLSPRSSYVHGAIIDVCGGR
jgi:NAD(P)-dependent dehydrogenase (short-subunit alcohol dehydrogenase family)